MNFDKKQLRNTLLLLLGALIWGTAFVAQSVGLSLIHICAAKLRRTFSVSMQYAMRK